LRALARNINLLNLFLLTATLVFAGYALSQIFNTNIKYTPLKTKKSVAEAKEQIDTQLPIPSPLEYTLIAEQNLFHPERKIPAGGRDEKLLPKPEFILYGTLITDEYSIAYMEDRKSPRITPGKGKRQIPLRKGGIISGFTLKEIEVDRVIMIKGDETIVVYINDPLKRKMRESSSADKTLSQPVVGIEQEPLTIVPKKSREAQEKKSTVIPAIPLIKPAK
jgi:hypothetical protein